VITKKKSPKPAKSASGNPKVLFLDLEVSTWKGECYGKSFEPKTVKITKHQHVYCFSYRINNGPVKVVALPDFPLYTKDPTNDYFLVKRLCELISECDLLVCHNIAFDLKMTRQRAILHKLTPFRPIRTFCTLAWARKNLNLPSNTLKDVADFFNVPAKKSLPKGITDGVDAGDPKAWRVYKDYNRGDTVTCSALFPIMQQWDARAVTIKPSVLCQNPLCGSDDVQWRGVHSNRREYTCKVCHRWGNIKF
jgi:hypothetical protein